MKEFRITGRKGIDDLIDVYPYCNPHDWPTFCPAFDDVTEESYKADKARYEQRVQEWNNSYVESLKSSGEYGKEYHTDFKVKELEGFYDHNASDYGEWGILMPKGTINKDKEPPKFGIKYNGDEGSI